MIWQVRPVIQFKPVRQVKWLRWVRRVRQF